MSDILDTARAVIALHEKMQAAVADARVNGWPPDGVEVTTTGIRPDADVALAREVLRLATEVLRLTERAKVAESALSNEVVRLHAGVTAEDREAADLILAEAEGLELNTQTPWAPGVVMHEGVMMREGAKTRAARYRRAADALLRPDETAKLRAEVAALKAGRDDHARKRAQECSYCGCLMARPQDHTRECPANQNAARTSTIEEAAMAVHNVSAQAAADAACFTRMSDAMADFGLAFGPPGARWEHALATDFAGLYTLGASTHGDGRWVWGYESLNGSDDDVGAVYADDRDKAIAGARAHDEIERLRERLAAAQDRMSAGWLDVIDAALAAKEDGRG